MQRKLVVAGIFIACLVLLLIKHYVYVNILGDVTGESSYTDAIILFTIGAAVAMAYWTKSAQKSAVKIVKSVPSSKQTEKLDFYTIPIAMSVFALYLLLFIMRLIIFINMYAEKPFMLMLEFPIIAIVAIFLFIPFIIKKIDLGDDDDDDEAATNA